MGPMERVERAASSLKVFPLPSAVLFPETALPLHIFEPRYRALLTDCLASDRVMALIDLKAGWESHYAGRPELGRIGCAGMVVFDEQLPDGRFNILLQGVTRFRVLEELPPAHLYREVRAELLPDAPYEGPLDELLRRSVLEIAERVSEVPAEELLHLAARQSGGALADLVAAALVPDTPSRHAILRELDVERRMLRVLDQLNGVMATLGALGARGPLN